MRLLHTEPLAKVVARQQEEAALDYGLSHAHVTRMKVAGDAATTYLSGELYASRSGWILLAVPNALVRGAFDALSENGAELPRNSKGSVNAHISVIRPEEVKRIGGIDRITERGHHFKYTLGPVKEVAPDGWDEMSKAWFIQVKSTELQNLRKSYGLSPLPNEGKFDFHITIAVRRKKVLQNNDVAKAASLLMPLLRAGGLAADVAGLKSLTAEPKENDPAATVDADDSYLKNIRQPRVQKRKVTRVKIADVLSNITNGVHDTYGKLENRYGPMMAKVILGTGAAGLPIPVPGSSLVTAAPALAAGEAMHAYSGDHAATEAKKEKHRQAFLHAMKTTALPAGLAGLAGLALHKPTDTLVPAQVTKFPGENKAHVIRGPIYHGAPTSVLEDTGGGYMYAGPEHFDRTHAAISNPETLDKAVRSQQRTGVPLQTLEIQGHGAFSGQDLGDVRHIHLPNGNLVSNPEDQLGPKTVDTISKTLNTIPRTDDATVIGYGCNTGLCAPADTTHPQNDWWQRLSDNTGMATMGARGYVSAEADAGRWQDVHHSSRGEYPPITADTNNIAGEDYSFTRYRPHQPSEKVVTQDRDTRSKQTFSSLPAGRIHELLYNIGKPSAIAGALAAPFVPKQETAKRVAMLSTALASPMALSEIITRLGEARGQIATGNADNSVGTYLSAQGKALPYIGLAALPLLSYSGAKALGRWNKRKPEQK